MSIENPQFLQKKYPLNTSPEVESAALRTSARTGEDFPSQSAEGAHKRIQNYLDRFEEFRASLSEVKNPDVRERGIERFKHLILDKNLTKYQDIPAGYWKAYESNLRNQGLSGDWASLSDEDKEKMRQTDTAPLLEDQKASLEEWIDYFLLEDADDIPPYLKYWVFRSVTGLQEYEKTEDNQKIDYTRRSKGSLKKFPTLQHEALRYVTDAVLEKYHGKTKPPIDEYDIQPEEKTEFQKYLEQENFAKLYAWANELINPIPEELLPITAGEWRTFAEHSDIDAAVATLRGKGTGLCIAGKGAARRYLDTGDLHIYYSQDAEGNPVFPRVAIHAKDTQVAEVRGIAYKQNIDPYMGDIVTEKLGEFANGEKYQRQAEDMKRLTTIEKRSTANQPLTKDDLIFLYEIDSTIQGFGYQRDPRIAELRQGRNSDEDMLIILDCSREQVAHTVDEVNDTTKAYVGPLETGIFQQLPTTLEHIYTSFPEHKITKEIIQSGGRTTEQLETDLEQADIKIPDNVKFMLHSPDFSTSKESGSETLITLTVADLKITGQTTLENIYKRAEELGLELCPAEVGPSYRLQYLDQPMNDWRVIGMKPISGADRGPRVFYLYRLDAGSWLCGVWAGPDSEWYAYYPFVFRLRKLET